MNENLLKNHYEENKNNFMSDERRSTETLLLDAKKYAQKLTVTPEEVSYYLKKEKNYLKEPEQRYIQQILVDDKDTADLAFKELNKKESNFVKIASKVADLSEEDIDLGWNTKSEMPEEIVDNIFQLKINNFSKPLKSSFGWHIIKILDIKEKKETKFEEVKNKFEKILLDKGKEAVYDLQDELEDLLASGSTFEEISKTLDVKLIKANRIDRNGRNPDGSKNIDYQDEKFLDLCLIKN